MTQHIPSTDTLHVALIAATLALMESTSTYATGSIEQRQQIFVDTYEILYACVTQSADDIRARVKARQPG